MRYVVFVCGNHEISMQLNAKNPVALRAQQGLKQALIDRPNVYYLEDSGCEIEGVRFYGSPWTTKFGRDWAFQLQDTEDEFFGLGCKFGSIPAGLDVLVTHQPPFGQGDTGDPGKRLGSRVLMEKIVQVSPRLSIFGEWDMCSWDM